MKKLQFLLICVSLIFPVKYYALGENENIIDPGKILKQLLVNIDQPKGKDWPPAFETSKKLSSIAYTTQSYNPGKNLFGFKVILSNKLIDNLNQIDENILAFILGHELAHIILNHVTGDNPSSSEIISNALLSEDEFEADFLGLKYAVEAGYNYNQIISGLHKITECTSYLSTFESLAYDHPSWIDRLSRLDKRDYELWRSVSAFKNGVTFLNLEKFDEAIYCFNFVIEQFPACYEAHLNIGYSKLMKYFDLLDYDDLKKFNLGCFSTGGYYKQPATLRPSIRGIYDDLWWDAVGEFQLALKFRPNLALAKANLGLAYILCPNRSNWAGKATKFFAEAVDLIETDQSLDSSLKAVIYLNAGLSNLLANDYKISNATQSFHKAIKNGRGFDRVQAGTKNQVINEISQGIKFNNALAITYSKDKPDVVNAMVKWQNFLDSEPRGSVWWSLGYDHYLSICSGQKTTPLIHQDNRNKNEFKRIVGVKSSENHIIKLSDSKKDLFSLLKLKMEDYYEKGIIPGKNLKRIIIKNPAIELISSEYIYAIILNQIESPEILLEGRRQRNLPPLKIGMARDKFEEIMKDIDFAYKPDFIGTGESYRFYSSLGLAVKFSPQNSSVKEFIITSINVN